MGQKVIWTKPKKLKIGKKNHIFALANFWISWCISCITHASYFKVLILLVDVSRKKKFLEIQWKQFTVYIKLRDPAIHVIILKKWMYKEKLNIWELFKLLKLFDSENKIIRANVFWEHGFRRKRSYETATFYMKLEDHNRQTDRKWTEFFRESAIFQKNSYSGEKAQKLFKIGFFDLCENFNWCLLLSVHKVHTNVLFMTMQKPHVW